MNDDTLSDLKQFIEATVSQQLTQQSERLESKIERVEKKIDDVRVELNNKIDDLSTSVAEALDTSNEVVDEQFADHEQRITRLEKNPPKERV